MGTFAARAQVENPGADARAEQRDRGAHPREHGNQHRCAEHGKHMLNAEQRQFSGRVLFAETVITPSS